MRFLPVTACVLHFTAAYFAAGSARSADPLPQLVLDPTKTTVSGLSSGAFMTVQLQTAFSSVIAGAGVVSGGSYGCADDSVYTAVFGCLVPPWYMVWPGPDAEGSLDTIRQMGSRIDPPADIAADRIYMFHGKADDTVRRQSMDVLQQVYDALKVPSDSINYVTDIDAGHAFLTEQGKVACAETAPDFLNDCDIDQAGKILQWLYPDIQSAGESVPTHLKEFSQSMYTEGAVGMDSLGYVYVPSACADGETCRLHIALHGCEQGRAMIGDEYARLTGYNRWAEANHIVVLYPQAEVVASSFWNPFSGNPKGCWDWWGYGGSDYLSKDAPQLAAIARMAAALGAPLSR